MECVTVPASEERCQDQKESGPATCAIEKGPILRRAYTWFNALLLLI